MKDNILTKIIRPATLLWFVLLFTAFSIFDGNFRNFTVRDIYIKGLVEILQAIIVVYVLGRSSEKITHLIKDKKDE